MTVRKTVQWPAAAKARVAEMWLSRTRSASEIAAIISQEYGLPASKSAIVGVAFRAGLSFQGRKAVATPESLAARRDRQAEARRAAKERRERRAAAKAPKPAPALKPPRRPVPAIPAALPSSIRIPFVDVREGECRYIADDPSGGQATCCGHATAQGSPWCPAHRAICVSGTVAKPSAWIPYSRLRRAA